MCLARMSNLSDLTAFLLYERHCLRSLPSLKILHPSPLSPAPTFNGELAKKLKMIVFGPSKLMLPTVIIVSCFALIRRRTQRKPFSGKTEKQLNKLRASVIDKKIERVIVKTGVKAQTDRQAHRQTHTHRPTDRQTDR